MHSIDALRAKKRKMTWRELSTRAATKAWRTATVKVHLRLPDVPRTPGVWAITVVRDEADVVGFSIDHLLEQGITHVMAVDHLSSDGTGDIMLERGDRVTVVRYSHPGFAQGAIMTSLARHAARHGAQWIVPFDADEVWSTRDGSPLAEHLLSRTDDVVRARCWNYFPTATDAADVNPFRRMTHRGEAPEVERSDKVAFRPHPRVTVGEGNHNVSPERPIGSGLLIADYPYRTCDQFIRKAIQGNAGLSAAKIPAHQGVHWRELSQHDADGLRQVWDDFVLTHQLPHHLWHAPEVVVNDPEARSLRRAGGHTDDDRDRGGPLASS